ncbi:MAG: CoA pyrophosphatase [Chloroflexota bacterium]
MNHYLCSQELCHRIQANLQTFKVVNHPVAGLKQAAVTLTVVNVSNDPGIYDIPYQRSWADHAALILTRRSMKLRKHAGQWALPGGRIEQGESPKDAALRELEEEVGLQLSGEHILGQLDDFTTRSGYVMKPIVVWGGPNVKLAPNPDEVASIHRIPLAEFMREDAPLLEKSTASEHPVLRMPIGTGWIAAPTAALLYQFREVAILGNETRVAHYDQPTFAWK